MDRKKESLNNRVKTSPKLGKKDNNGKHELPGAKLLQKLYKKYIIYVYPLCKLVTPLVTISSLRSTQST